MLNNDLLMGLSAKIERLYGKMTASEVNSRRGNNEVMQCINSLKDEVEKTNSLLEKIYEKIK